MLKQITHSINPEWVGNEYSSCCPFNCNNTRLLFIKRDHFGLYDGDGIFIDDLPINASQEPRWDRTNPDALYCISTNRLMKLDTSAIASPEPSVLRSFSEYVKISGCGESDISPDGDHFVLSGTRTDGVHEVFVYRISTNAKDVIYPQTEPFDGLKIDSRNRPIVSRAEGIYLLAKGTARKIAPANGHACAAVHNGRPVLLWSSSNDPFSNMNALVLIEIDTGVQEILHVFSWAESFHVSACDRDFCLVSTDVPSRDLPSQLWKIYFDKMKPAELLGETGSLFTGYNSQVKAALSRDGSKVVGCSNFGKTTDPNYCDVFLMTIDATAPVDTLTTDTRIDYSPWFGKSVFVMVPRPDGALDIFERKV